MKEEEETKEREKKAVFLPADLYDRIEERVHATEFHSVEEYVIFVLEEVLGGEEDSEEEEPAFSEAEEEEVKKRLRALGYLE
ncbi:MAG: CopG family transcriptional regulator [Euryarchaeota archaeon]|nr:CopG family transcriptional regulator [Euryarchaeota archaeon]